MTRQMPASKAAPHRLPTIGILTAPPGRAAGSLHLPSAQPFGERSEQFSALTRLAHRRGALLYVFAPAEIDWSSQRVNAAVYSGGRWIKRQLPLPHVVYNRLPSRGVEAHPLCRLTKARLARIGIPLFNPGFFDKWLNHRVLHRHSALRSHLPETEAFTGIPQLLRLLRLFPHLYCKPRQGHAGSGIMLLEAGPAGYLLRSLGGGEVKAKRYASLGALARAAAARMMGKAYLVQRAVPVATYRDRAFDFRLLLHKSPAGRWRVTGVGVRVAGRGGITTHVPNGGSLAGPEEVVTQVFGETLRQQNGVYRRARKLAMVAAQALDQHYRHGLAEMSMDITAGPQGHLWFFEANAKPMRFDEPKIQQRWRRRLLRYALSRVGVGP